jgi:hypothetical protein
MSARRDSSKLAGESSLTLNVLLSFAQLTGGLFVDANDLPVSLAAKLDFAGPSVETLDAYRR